MDLLEAGVSMFEHRGSPGDRTQGSSPCAVTGSHRPVSHETPKAGIWLCPPTRPSCS